MGLDVYVGTLTRYHAGEWETIVQQHSKTMGIETRVVRPGGDGESVPIAQVEEAVLRWRTTLATGLAPHGAGPCDWPEGTSPPYFTDKPDWEGYSALLTWAAYAEHPGRVRPLKTLSDWRGDEVVQLSQAKESPGTYDHLLLEAELWLPVDFEFTFAGPDVLGNSVQMASVDTLHRQLTALNEATWRADTKTISEWRRAGLPDDKDLERGAQAGFAMFYELCSQAKAERLPIRLDY
jgi:hypothetical protein